ncbi:MULTISPECIES: CTP synthase [unclassified Thermosipho (in: thermotogales)]|uniref:CTP synthase n=1 Tax=unclassified Thermosipho (in: thermotogales) TaxID=2676525 RepID=UPI000985D2E7|nr:MULTISPECIES: CTP synthase [unclassified Thermosipho (in: thermotogales)]MBT1247080.1 CTP synthetase [Thermosipho sp. 1244]OOC46865.1 CTP synthetase [Thermosipho sp. 1223]
MPQKFIVVTGGVLSGIGKGIFSASLARILKDSGIDVNILKIDPYLNVDAGTMNPNQHGEVFVTDDGYEADLDLGHYERFLGINVSRKNNITAGQIYFSVIQRERDGRYLGSTVQIVPHVTSEIKDRIKSMDGELLVIEIGGTVGDIEGEVFLEAVRELAFEVGRENFHFVHVTYVPYLRTTNEFKTKPTQQSVQLLRKIGIHPDTIIVRTEMPIDANSLFKVALFSGVPKNRVINLPDVSNVYEVPVVLHSLNLHNLISEKLNLNIEDNFSWSYPKSFELLKIGIVGKYLGTDDAYKSIIESIYLSGAQKPVIVDAQELEDMTDEQVKDYLDGFDALIIPGGFGRRGIEGKIKAIKYARENKKPILGICLGMQLMAIEFARNVGGYEGANSTEFDPNTPYPVVNMMESQKEILKLGGTMRLGAQKTNVLENTLLSKIYGNQLVIYERHRHRYEVDAESFSDIFKLPGNEGYKLTISAKSDFVEAVELEDHPFFLGVQYHPEYKSKVGTPHPIFKWLVNIAGGKK